jgi:hypothetical protein
MSNLKSILSTKECDLSESDLAKLQSIDIHDTQKIEERSAKSLPVVDDDTEMQSSGGTGTGWI